jgi:hypothetical protein
MRKWFPSIVNEDFPTRNTETNFWFFAATAASNGKYSSRYDGLY